MGIAFQSLRNVIEKMEGNEKVEAVFVTDIGGKPVDWNMIFQFNLNNEDPFYIEIKARKVRLLQGEASNPDIIMMGDNEAIVKICEGKGDFTHAISREHISVVKGMVIEVIRLTRAITLVLKTK